MKGRTLLIIISFLVLFSVTVGAILVKYNFLKQPKVCFENHCFDVDLAVTSEERSRGLMFREELELNRGMFFVFEKTEECPFWMKNTLIPLDIIWINENNEVVFISENTQPCGENCFSINPGKEAKYVLEINGGLSEKIELKEGARLDFLYF